MVAAAVPRAPRQRQRQQRAIGGEVAGGVVARRRRQERRPVGATLVADAGHRLRHLLPTTAVG